MSIIRISKWVSSGFLPQKEQKQKKYNKNSKKHKFLGSTYETDSRKWCIQLRATSGYVIKAGFCWSPHTNTEIEPLLVFTRTSCNVKIPNQKMNPKPINYAVLQTLFHNMRSEQPIKNYDKHSIFKKTKKAPSNPTKIKSRKGVGGILLLSEID